MRKPDWTSQIILRFGKIFGMKRTDSSLLVLSLAIISLCVVCHLVSSFPAAKMLFLFAAMVWTIIAILAFQSVLRDN